MEGTEGLPPSRDFHAACAYTGYAAVPIQCPSSANPDHPCAVQRRGAFESKETSTTITTIRAGGPSADVAEAPLQSGTITAGLRLVAFAAWGSRRVQGTLGVLQLLPAACMQQRYIAHPRRLPARAHLKPPHTPRVIMAARCSPGGVPCLRGARTVAGDVPSARVSAGLCCLHRREPASGVCDCVRQ
jgi:hypothetical protein